MSQQKSFISLTNLNNIYLRQFKTFGDPKRVNLQKIKNG